MHDLEFDRITFLQCSVAIADNRRIVYEYIGPVFSPDETITLCIVKPLYRSLHSCLLWQVNQCFLLLGRKETSIAAMSTNRAECTKLKLGVKVLVEEKVNRAVHF